MFIIQSHYTKPLTEVDLHRQDHLNHINKYFAKDVFLIAGRTADGQGVANGSIIMANAPAKAAIIEIMEKDPYILANVARYEITEFNAGIYNGSLEGLVS